MQPASRFGLYRVARRRDFAKQATARPVMAATLQ